VIARDRKKPKPFGFVDGGLFLLTDTRFHAQNQGREPLFSTVVVSYFTEFSFVVNSSLIAGR
jgi:hypothetical protein